MRSATLMSRYASNLQKRSHVRAITRSIHLWPQLPGEQSSALKRDDKLKHAARYQSITPTTGNQHYDVAIVGGGIVGLATAREILKRFPQKTLVVLEKEREVAAHQTGHNSGVIHAGIYYKPGSVMAHTCVRGASLMYKYCEEHNLPAERCGKLIVAADEKEHEIVKKLFDTATKNGVQGLEILDHKQILEKEPNVKGYSALWSPNTGIVDYQLVAQSIADEIVGSGKAEIKLAFEVKRIEQTPKGNRLSGTEPTMDGPERHVTATNVITCAGFYADRVAKIGGGVESIAKVVPFRGTYYQMKPEFRGIVKTNVYPVPSGGGIPVGVHFTPTVNSRRGHQVIVGPGACIAFSREGYRFFDFSLRDMIGSLTNINFWKFALGNLQLSIGELYRDLNKRAFLRSVHKLIPDIKEDMVDTSFSGVMSQVFLEGGAAASDYIFERKVMNGTALHVRNAPSPACTGSLAIAEIVADIATEDFNWK